MAGLKKVAVVIPFYREELSHFEKIALSQCEKILAAYPKIAIKPIGLSVPAEIAVLSNLSEISFDPEYFKDIHGYNRFVISKLFYEAFAGFEYILIHQLDAFVFKDELDYWCDQDFDYIGAPWLRSKEYKNQFKSVTHQSLEYLHTRFNIKKQGVPTERQFINKVGNGGFSLRRIPKFIEVCNHFEKTIEQYNARQERQFNEDIFWGIEVNRKQKILNIPDYKQAVKFAVESSPEFALILNDGELPFGCHAWDRYIDFWRPVFKELGYTI